MMRFINFTFFVVFLSFSGEGLVKNNGKSSVFIAAQGDIHEEASTSFRGYNDEDLLLEDDHHRGLIGHKEDEEEDTSTVLEEYKTDDGLLTVQFLEPLEGEIIIEVTTEDENAMNQFLEIQENAGEDISSLYENLVSSSGRGSAKVKPKGRLLGAICRLEKSKRENRNIKNKSIGIKNDTTCPNPFLADDDMQQLGEELVEVDIDDLAKNDEEENNDPNRGRGLKYTYGSKSWFANAYCRFTYKNDWCSCRSSVWGYSSYVKESDDFSVLVYNSGPGATTLNLYQWTYAPGTCHFDYYEVNGSPKYVYKGQIKYIHAISGSKQKYRSTTSTNYASTNYRVVRWDTTEPKATCGSTKCPCGPIWLSSSFP